MALLAAAAGVVIIALVLFDVSLAVAFAGRVERRLWPARAIHRATWSLWAAVARLTRAGTWRDVYLSLHFPATLSLLVCLWAGAIILAFALLLSALSSGAAGADSFPETLRTSASAFLPFGPKRAVTDTTAARTLLAVEAGAGLFFSALVVAYLFMIYRPAYRLCGAMSTSAPRGAPELSIGGLAERHARRGGIRGLLELLSYWERWAVAVRAGTEAHPALAYFRGRHAGRPWLADLTAVMDVCGALISTSEGELAWQARRTFGAARRVVTVVARHVGVSPCEGGQPRDLLAVASGLRAALAAKGVSLKEEVEARQSLSVWTGTYEPYVNALSEHLLLPLGGREGYTYLPERRALGRANHP